MPWLAFARGPCHTVVVTENAIDLHHRLDSGWPELPEDQKAVTELSSNRAGNLSPFGELLALPLPVSDINYLHPYTVPNRG